MASERCRACTKYQSLSAAWPQFLCTRRVGCEDAPEVPTGDGPVPPPVMPEPYCLGLLTGEMGEALAVLGNMGRFGVDTPGHGGVIARRELEAEIGDVLAAIDFAIAHGVVHPEAVGLARRRKWEKLCNPASVDHLGRKLAPTPRSWLGPEAAAPGALERVVESSLPADQRKDDEA
jgi:hypothetical protein